MLHLLGMIINPKELFGKKVRDLRKNAGWSQEDLADSCGINRTYIGAIERGERNISLENIVKIAHALGVRPSDLLEDVS